VPLRIVLVIALRDELNAGSQTFYCGHAKSGKPSLEKGMLEMSLEQACQGFGWQSTGVEATDTAAAAQCNASNQGLHSFFPSCTQLYLLPVRTLIQL